MIPVIIIGLAFAWLLIETDYMRVRLYMGVSCKRGDCCEWRLSESQVTKQMKHELLCIWELSKVDRAKFDGEHIAPLFGWAYAYQFRHFTPEYIVELIGQGYKTTIRSHSTQALRDACRVNRNPHLKINLRKPSYGELAKNTAQFAKA